MPDDPYLFMKWQYEAGLDEILEAEAINQLSNEISGPENTYDMVPAPIPIENKKENHHAKIDEQAWHMAQNAQTLQELEQIIQSYDGCALKKTATRMVFADGNPQSGIMLIGEAPGAEEDRQGKPFVGPAGQLLDRMIGSIGLDRKTCYITNVCFWRPPGNRKPSEAEWAASLPFVRRHIEMISPKIIFLLGGSAAQQILEKNQGISHLRGRFFDLVVKDLMIPTLATFHPAYLLRQPAAKKQAWQDLRLLNKFLMEKQIFRN